MIAELIGVVVIRKMMCCFFDAPFKVQPMEYMDIFFIISSI